MITETKESVGILYRSMQIYDFAPKNAQKLFGDIIDSPDEIEKKFLELYKKTENPLMQQTIGVAYNYATITTLLRNGEADKAVRMIDSLSEKDASIWMMNNLLEDFNSNYKEECMKKKSLITPSELDEILFTRWAPKSIEHINDYFERQAMFTATKIGDNKYFCNGVVKIKTPAIIENKDIGTVVEISAAGMFRTILEGEEEQLETKLEKEIEKSNIPLPEYTIILSEHKGMNNYMVARYMIKNYGQEIGDELLNMDWNHKIDEIK